MDKNHQDKTEQQQTWWQKKEKSLRIVGIIVVCVLGLVLVIGGYLLKWDWTGFNASSIIWTVKAPNGTASFTVDEQQPPKAFWDWLQLLGILAIPVVVGFGAAWFTSRQTQASEANRAQQERESEANRERRYQTEIEIAEKNRERRYQTEIEIAVDNQHEASLIAYIDKISELLLEKQLDNSRPKDQVRKVARIQTLTVLYGLNSMRKRTVLQFLYESSLINKNINIVDLRGADLSDAHLFSAHLSDAHLSDADLSSASLNGASLSNTKLSKANLSDADLYEANLSGADLSDVDLSDTELYLVNLSGAKLSDTERRNADLNNTDLRNADLRNAIVTQEQLAQAKSLQGATMPDGSKHP